MAQQMANPAKQNPMAMGMGGMGGMQQPQQQKQIFKPQIDNLELISHHFALNDCPKHALNRLKYVLGEK